MVSSFDLFLGDNEDPKLMSDFNTSWLGLFHHRSLVIPWLAILRSGNFDSAILSAHQRWYR